MFGTTSFPCRILSLVLFTSSSIYAAHVRMSSQVKTLAQVLVVRPNPHKAFFLGQVQHFSLHKGQSTTRSPVKE